MSWFAELAGKAETLLNNLDEQTGAALRTQNVKKTKPDKTSYTHPPDGIWGQRTRRPMLRNSKKPMVTETKSMFTTTRKPSPTNHSLTLNKASHTESHSLRQKSPTRIRTQQYNLNNCPKTLVYDVQGDSEPMDYRKRRYSLPMELEVIPDESDLSIHSQNLEVENAILKNEINIINIEVTQLLGQLRKADEGNDVNRLKELTDTRMKLEDSKMRNHQVNLEKDSLTSQLLLLKEKIQEIAKLEQNYQGEKQSMVTKNSLLKDTNNYLEDRVKDLTKKLDEANSTQQKLESELRHSQSIISELKFNLEKSNGECQRLEKDWETYKLRVKSMLHAKDNEIKSLQDGVNLTEDTKVLVEQLENLKIERNDLSEAIANVRNECDSMKLCLSQVENRHMAAKKVVAALRDALKEERSARNNAETQLLNISKELKNMQTETGQTIASLRTALRDKDAELTQLRETTSSVKTVDASSLNVADYDVTQDSIENEKIHYLTETLVQRQGKVDKLLADNNMLRIQLDKLESKLKAEMSQRAHNNHSVVNIQSGDHRTRRAPSESLVTVISHRIAAVIRRHPVLRIFVIIYMICLHFWVVTVLLTSTPAENFERNK